MINPDDINQHKSFSSKDSKHFEKKLQIDDLSYLSSIAFEQFKVNDSEINELKLRIDKKTYRKSYSFNTIFISVLCGLFIGISIFFILFQKSKIHPSVFQIFNTTPPEIKLENKINSNDTVFPAIPNKSTEHYQTIVNNAIEEQDIANDPQTLPSKPLSLDVPEINTNDDILYQFTPNAPVIFIHNLKVTNYRLYYFNHQSAINLSVSNGLSAQYGSNSDIERTSLTRSNSYYAHKMIQKAMNLFSSKHIDNCIEELTMLYEFNHDDANAQFYLGMCYFQIGKYGIAKNYFQKNLDNINNIFHQESEFYQALCLLNLKQTQDANAQLQTIINNKGFYSARAKETLEKQK